MKKRGKQLKSFSLNKEEKREIEGEEEKKEEKETQKRRKSDVP